MKTAQFSRKTVMETAQFSRKTNIYRYVTDRHGKILRKLWSSQCFVANEFPEDITTLIYNDKESNPERFTKSIISVQYFDRDIQDLESEDDERMSWMKDPITIDWGDGDVREYIQGEFWGTSVKNGIGLGVDKKVFHRLNQFVHNDEKAYFGERSYAANNVSGINVKDMMIDKVKGGTPIWSYTQLVEIAHKMGFTEVTEDSFKTGFTEVTEDSLKYMGIPVIKDGCAAVPKGKFQSLWDENLIHSKREMYEPPKVVHMKNWRPNVMMSQWVSKNLIPHLLKERIENIKMGLEIVNGVDGNGKKTFIKYMVQPNPYAGEDSVGIRMINADNQDDPTVQHHPFLCHQIMDPKAEFLFSLITTGIPDLQGFVLAPLSNPEKLYTSTEGLNVGPKWTDNGKRIIFPSADKFERMKDILHNGENSITRYPVDSPLASQVGLSQTKGFLSELLALIRVVQYESLMKDEDGNSFFKKGLLLIIPDEFWNHEADMLVDAEDVKCHTNVRTEEGFINLKKDFKRMICSGMIGAKQIYGEGSTAWISMSIGKGFNGDYDGDMGCVESGKTYPITVAAKRLTCEFYETKLANPKLTKTFSMGHRVKSFTDSLGGHLVVGTFTNLSICLCNLPDEELESVAKVLNTDLVYNYITSDKCGYLEKNEDFSVVDRMWAVIAVGIKVGTDCFKTRTELKYWKGKGRSLTAALKNNGVSDWLLQYNPRKDSAMYFACRTNQGLPIKYWESHKPVSLADHIAFIVLVSGLRENGDYIRDSDGNPLLLRLNDPYLEMYPLSYYKQWAMPPQSDEEWKIANILFSTNTALMEGYDFTTPKSFLQYWNEVWGVVINKALKGFIPSGVSKKLIGGKVVTSVESYVPYGLSEPLDKWHLANILWYRFSIMTKSAWRSCASVIYPFQDEVVRIVAEKPGLALSHWSYFENSVAMQLDFKVPIAGEGQKHLQIGLEESIEVYVLSKRLPVPMFVKDKDGKPKKHKKTGEKIIKGFNHVYRTVLTPCEDYNDLEPGDPKLAQLTDPDLKPDRHCRTDNTADWIVDGLSGVPYTGIFTCRFSREKGRTYANLTKEKLG